MTKILERGHFSNERKDNTRLKDNKTKFKLKLEFSFLKLLKLNNRVKLSWFSQI